MKPREELRQGLLLAFGDIKTPDLYRDFVERTMALLDIEDENLARAVIAEANSFLSEFAPLAKRKPSELKTLLVVKFAFVTELTNAMHDEVKGQSREEISTYWKNPSPQMLALRNKSVLETMRSALDLFPDLQPGGIYTLISKISGLIGQHPEFVRASARPNFTLFLHEILTLLATLYTEVTDSKTKKENAQPTHH